MTRRPYLALLLSLSILSGASAASAAGTASAVSQEPFFAGLVSEAGRLKAETAAFTPSLALLTRPEFTAYARDIRALSAGDLQGHRMLKARGTDNDLKCILTGVSRDLTVKIDAIEAAKSDDEIRVALTHMTDLLSDNIDVIVTPATTDSGLDCVIEFGPDA